MSKDKPRNLPASVRERLRQAAAARKEEFQLVLTRYGLERLSSANRIRRGTK